MSPRQKALYFREWGNCRRALLELGYSSAEADAQRHRIHIEQLGRDVSSKVLTNSQLDAILSGFRAYSRPDDLMGQLRQLDQPDQRVAGYRARAAALAADCGVVAHGRTAYLDQLARRICGRAWLALSETEIAKICGVLAVQAKRHKPAPVSTAKEEDNPF
jgi:hypothetical protein